MLSDEERDRVAAAIREAERRTAGEIVVVVAARASAYRSVPLLYALVGGLAAPWPLIWLTALSAARIFAIQLIVALALVVLFSLRSYVPGFIRHARCREAAAREAAAREFAARGLSRTRGRTGVLIYVAAAEHYAEVVADAGIAAHVDETVWRDIIADLIAAMRAGSPAEGLIIAVNRVGEILARHAPPRGDDRDELPNKVILA
jgi:putative membrane protein